MAETEEVNLEEERGRSLVAWITEKVDTWEDYRETNFDPRFKAYYRLFRGLWNPDDKNRDSERSKLISPALQQAVEATVAELEEASFGKGPGWFDLHDDIKDEVKGDMDILRLRLLDEMDENQIKDAVSRVYLNGAIFGTGIAKLIAMDGEVPKLGRDANGAPTVTMVPKFRVKLEHINPMEFVIDPGARTVDEALGCAHIIPKARADIMGKQAAGLYRDVPLGEWPEGQPMYNYDFQLVGTGQDTTDLVKITEYHGKIPKALLPVETEEDEEVVSFAEQQVGGGIAVDYDDADLVEAIVTIANDQVLLRADKNATLTGFRSIIAYQHDTVNESFWGRGICEKGFNAQKALDSELRARIDAMAFAGAPMMAADATRLPRGHRLSVRPGKLWLTNGDPSSVFMPLKFLDGNSATFHQAGDLERMVQMGTGAMDTAAPLTQNPRNQTASGMSMMQSAMIKRSKRTMQNVERQFLDPLVKRTAYYYMQFDSDNFPPFDPAFKVSATMGIAAREYEIQQMTQMMQIIPPEHPMFSVLISGLVENTSLTNKAQLKEALEKAQQPDPAQQQQQQVAMQTMMGQLEKLQAEVEELRSKSVKNYADAAAKSREPAQTGKPSKGAK